VPVRGLAYAILLAPALASAEPEVGVIAGGHAFSDSSELGSRDGDMTLPGPDAGSLLGIRAALPVHARVAVEGEATAIPTRDDVLGDRVNVYGLAAHARVDLLRGRLRPFVVAGLGVQILRTSSPQMNNDSDQAFHWGVGARWALRDDLDVRLDARHLIVPNRVTNGATSEVELTAGLTFRIGAKKRERVEAPTVIVELPAPPPIEPPPAPAPAPVLDELAGISFEADSARLSDESRPILLRALALLRDHPEVIVEISGHTSSEGDALRNLYLSRERAEAVKGWLVAMGIPSPRIIAVGHGEDVPLADNATDIGRRINRRIEFRILVRAE